MDKLDLSTDWKKIVVLLVSLAIAVVAWGQPLLLLFLIIGFASVYPLEKIQTNEIGYETVRRLHIEVYLIVSFVLFIMADSTAWRMRQGLFGNVSGYLHLIWLTLFIASVGYFVYYLKSLSVNDWQITSEESLVRKWFRIDLKKEVNFKIFIAIFIQPLIIFIMVLYANSHRNPLDVLLTMVGIYLFLLFFYIRSKAAKTQKDYRELLSMTSALASGDLKIDTTADLGIFESLKEELATIRNGVEMAVESAISSERLKGDLITNVSHDLKTPLTSIITYVDLLQVEGLSEEKRVQYLKTLESKTDRLKTLIEDLFEVSKATSGNLELEMTKVDVVTLMKQTILGLSDRINEVNLDLRESYSEESMKMKLDGARMHRVFENLIINMCKYSLPGTRSYIDITENEKEFKIIFRNISNYELSINESELTDRFVRGEQSRSTDGSGLGLAIAKSFVELHDGKFKITTDGDLFKVEITF